MIPSTARLRDRRLRALGVAPLRLRRRGSAAESARVSATAAPVAANAAAPPAATEAPIAESATAEATAIRRLALEPDSGALGDPVIRSMYAALTDAVGKAGLQPVRVCDVAGDPAAAVMVFGDAPVPAGVPEARVLRVDPLAVLHADRTRKRLLWERMQALGRRGA